MCQILLVRKSCQRSDGEAFPVLEVCVCDDYIIYVLSGATPYLISSMALIVPGLLDNLNHCFWEETMKCGVMRWGSLNSTGEELSAPLKPPLHLWSRTHGKPPECSHFPQSPNTGGAHVGGVCSPCEGFIYAWVHPYRWVVSDTKTCFDGLGRWSYWLQVQIVFMVGNPSFVSGF